MLHERHVCRARGKGGNEGIEIMWKTIRRLAMTLRPIYKLAVIVMILLFFLSAKKGYLSFLSIQHSFNKDSHDQYTIFTMNTPIKPENPSESERPKGIKKPTVKAHRDSQQTEALENTATIKEEAIKDKNNQLIWQKNVQNNFLTWTQAQEFCNSLDLGGYLDWRLPTRTELESLVDKKQIPPINPLFGSLPDKDAPYFWTSTIDLSDHDEAWLLNFKNGLPFHINKEKKYGFARCVRNG